MLLLSSYHSVLIKVQWGNICFWKWSRKRDQIYLPNWNDQNFRQNILSNSFKTLNIRQQQQQKKWSLRDEKWMRWSITIAPTYCLESVSRMSHKEEKFRQGPMDSLSWGDRAKYSENRRQLDFTGQSTREARSTKRISETWKALLIFNRALIGTCVWGN